MKHHFSRRLSLQAQETYIVASFCKSGAFVFLAALAFRLQLWFSFGCVCFGRQGMHGRLKRECPSAHLVTGSRSDANWYILSNYMSNCLCAKSMCSIWENEFWYYFLETPCAGITAQVFLELVSFRMSSTIIRMGGKLEFASKQPDNLKALSWWCKLCVIESRCRSNTKKQSKTQYNERNIKSIVNYK